MLSNLSTTTIQETIEDLQAELARRANQSHPPPPTPVAKPDFGTLQAMCQAHINALAQHGGNLSSDVTHYIYEEAMEACFGRDVWDWMVQVWPPPAEAAQRE